jgi:hypothetical protein
MSSSHYLSLLFYSFLLLHLSCVLRFVFSSLHLFISLLFSFHLFLSLLLFPFFYVDIYLCHVLLSSSLFFSSLYLSISISSSLLLFSLPFHLFIPLFIFSIFTSLSSSPFYFLSISSTLFFSLHRFTSSSSSSLHLFNSLSSYLSIYLFITLFRPSLCQLSVNSSCGRERGRACKLFSSSLGVCVHAIDYQVGHNS